MCLSALQSYRTYLKGANIFLKKVVNRSGQFVGAVGAIAAGPVGAAVGAVANAVLDKPLQGIGSRTYRVTGPWKSPKVETIDRARAPTNQPPVEPPG